MRILKQSLLAASALMIAHSSLGETKITGDAHALTVETDVSNFEFIVIAGPNELRLKSESLSINNTPPLPDGHYVYELSANKGSIHTTINETMNNGRDASQTPGEIIAVIDRGHFTILNGQLPSNIKEKPPESRK